MSKSLVYYFIATIVVFTFTCGCNRKVHQDAQGKFHGSGDLVYYYESGQKLRADSFDRGVLRTSVWYSPTGNEVFRTDWGVNGEGFDYIFYENGALKSKTTMKNWVADGTSWEYDEHGKLVGQYEYENGVRK